MELREYYNIIRKWWWLLVLCTALGAGSSYLFSRRMERTWEASTLLMIGGSLDVVNPTTGELQTSEKLAQTYAELVKTDTILATTMTSLNLPRLPREKVTVALIRNTQLMRITVADSDPRRAAATADELARQLILQSPSGPQRQEQVYREFVGGQLEELQREIASLSDAVIQARDADDQATVQNLQKALSERRTQLSALLVYLKDSSINYIRVIEPAKVPTVPSKPKVAQNTLLAGVVGLMLAGGAAFLIEYLDDSLKDPGQVEQVLGSATLGVIAQISSNGATPEHIALEQPKSPYAEAYRMLRTNLRYAVPASKGKPVFEVTSIGPSEGKTTTVCNLGVVTAQSGQRTILVDADLRRPKLHKIMDLANEVGLTSLLVGEVNEVEQALQQSAVENLRILTSGPIPPNPAELLDSPRMREIIAQLGEIADVIFMDTPPLLAVTDASVLAPVATGTILVAEVGRTRLDGCAQAVEMIRKVGGNLIGIVLNRLDLSRRGYYYDNYYYRYYYYTSHYGDNDGGDGQGEGKSGHRSSRRHRAGREILGVRLPEWLGKPRHRSPSAPNPPDEPDVN